VGTRSDAELIAACRRGDLYAFEVLYRRHRDWAVSLAYRFCGHRDDALDVLQEVFAYVLQKLPDLKLTALFTTFLYPVVKHRALDKVRARKRLAATPAEFDPETFAAPDERAPGEIRELLTGLSAIHQEVVWLRFAEGLDLREIALALRVPLGTVKSRLHLALSALREKLAHE